MSNHPTDAEMEAQEKERFDKWHPKTHEVAKIKYQKALVLIERAQNILALAAQELSPLCCAADQHTLVCRKYDDVRQLWRDIAYSSARNDCYIDDYGIEGAKKEYPELLDGAKAEGK